MQLNINISGYEGPLDLLLELSKKQKVDIKKYQYCYQNIVRKNVRFNYIECLLYLNIIKQCK